MCFLPSLAVLQLCRYINHISLLTVVYLFAPYYRTSYLSLSSVLSIFIPEFGIFFEIFENLIPYFGSFIHCQHSGTGGCGSCVNGRFLMTPRPLHRSFLRSTLLPKVAFQGTILLLGLYWLAYTLRVALPAIPFLHYNEEALTFLHNNDDSSTLYVSNVLDLSRHHVEPLQESHTIKAAVCYKALFGEIDFGIILQWIGTSS